MQLSTSVTPPDSSLAVPALPGMPASDPHGAAGKDPVAFDSLLPGQGKTTPSPAKKSAESASSTGSEAAAAIWSAWFAALAPTPAPTAKTSGEGVNESADTCTTSGLQSGGALPLAPGDLASGGKTVPGQPFFLPRSNSTVADPPAPPAAGVAGDAMNQVPAVPGSPGAISLPVSLPAAAAGEKLDLTALATSSPENAELTAEVSANSAAQSASRDLPASAPLPPKGKGGVSDVAKFAARSTGLAPSSFRAFDAEDNKILNAVDKEVTSHESYVGTVDANTAPVSTLLAKSSPPTSLASLSSGTSAQLQPVPFAAQPASSADVSLLAHRAVDAVKSATEYLDAGNRTTVRLQFSVGDANLSVHVELRAGQIHATFRTDSGDLRSALASEWQAMGGESGRAVRFADPVFAPATDAGHSAGLGDSPAQQRNSGERAPMENFEAAFPSPPARAAPAPAAATDRRPAPLRSNLNLYTFA